MGTGALYAKCIPKAFGGDWMHSDILQIETPFPNARCCGFPIFAGLTSFNFGGLISLGSLFTHRLDLRDLWKRCEDRAKACLGLQMPILGFPHFGGLKGKPQGTPPVLGGLLYKQIHQNSKFRKKGDLDVLHGLVATACVQLIQRVPSPRASHMCGRSW